MMNRFRKSPDKNETIALMSSKLMFILVDFELKNSSNHLKWRGRFDLWELFFLSGKIRNEALFSILRFIE